MHISRSPINKSLLKLSAVFGAIAITLVALAMIGSATAAPLPLNARGGTGAPPPNATVPATIPVGSPTVSLPTNTPGGATATRTRTPVPATPTVPHPVPTGQPTAPVCVMQFIDVQPTDWYYDVVRWMFCSGIVQGYSDGTFRPGNLTTRGQIAKIMSAAFGLPEVTLDGPHFADVPLDHTFYAWVETAWHWGLVSGYPCGGAGEPCVGPGNLPYFRPGGNVTRGQITKIAVMAALVMNRPGWQLITPSQATFADVPAGSTFFSYIETAVAHGVISGYDCGGAGEPCPGGYFRPSAGATRAQLSKIAVQAVTQP